jgi:membrane protease YdiL (CAAX protease family)
MTSKADLPYYNGMPVDIAPRGWLAILVSVVAGFLLLILLPFPSFPLNLVPAILFTGLPLLTLAAISGGRHGALFGRFGLTELAIAIGFGLLTMAISFAVGLVLLQFTTMTANATAAELANIGPAEIAIFLSRTAIQLLGEELLTVLPLLAIVWLCTRHFGLSRRLGLTIAVLVSTAWFAAVHLPTYDWNLIQCFAGIGSARLVLTAAFLVTRNLWVSTGAHIVNDWTEFLLPTLLAFGYTPIEAEA